MAEEHPTTVSLTNAKNELEKEYVKLSAQMQTYRATYEELASRISPLEEKQREAEKGMDEIKPRLSLVSLQLSHLKNALPEDKRQ